MSNINLQTLAESVVGQWRDLPHELKLAGLALRTQIEVGADAGAAVTFEVHDTHKGSYCLALHFEAAESSNQVSGMISDHHGRAVSDMGQAWFDDAARGREIALEIVNAAMVEISDRFRRRVG